MIKQLGMAILIGIFFGLFFGFLTGHYFITFLHALSIAFTIWFFNSLLHLFLVSKMSNFPRGKKLRIEIALFFLASLLGFLIPIYVFSKVFSFGFYDTRIIIANIGLLVVLYGVISGLVYSFRFYRELKEKETAEERLKALAAEAELRALRAQINPHFLFNTLNSTAELIFEDPKRAEDSVIRLSNLYRKVLSISDQTFIPIGEEIGLVEDMLELEKLRFEDRLTYRISCPESLKERKIPGLLIEPLVENVIKHVQSESGITIDINIRMQDETGRLYIELGDNGQGYDVNKTDSGFGLFSVQERLRLLYGEDCTFDVQSMKDEGTRVSIQIPIGVD